MGWEAFGRTSNQQRLEQMGLVDEEELRRLAKGPPATWLVYLAGFWMLDLDIKHMGLHIEHRGECMG